MRGEYKSKGEKDQFHYEDLLLKIVAKCGI